MATTKEQVIIDLEVDTKDVEKSEKDVEKLTGQILKLEKQIKSNKTEMKKSDAELQRNNTSRKQLAVTVAKQQQSLAKARRERTQNIKVLKAENTSLNGLMATTNKMVASRNKQILSTAKGRKEFARLTTQINKNNVSLKKYDAQISRNQRNVGNYPKGLKAMSAGFSAALGPIAAIIATIQAMNAALQHTFELSKITSKVTKLFGETGVAAEKMAAQVSALSTALETDYKEVLISANAVSKEFGISGTEALNLIEEGFKKGSNNSGQFLDILKEYPVQLKSIGLDAAESFAIINQQVTAGVYSDKGIDSLKEAGISLRENTDAVKAALSPLSEQVKLQIQQEVASGNTFKAMQLISTELKTAGLNAAQTQAIMSDVFKGAGEDSAAFVMNLDQVSLSLDDVANQTTIVEDATLNMDTSWNSFLLSIESGDGVISKTIAALKNGFSDVISSLTDLNNESATFFETLGKSGIFGEGFKIRSKAAIQARKLEQQLNAESKKEASEVTDLVVEKTEEEIKEEEKQTEATKKELEKRQKAHQKYLENVSAGEIKLRELEIRGMESGYDKELAIIQLKQDKEQSSLTKSLENQDQLNAALLLSDSNYLKQKAELYNEFFEVNRDINLEQINASNTLELETLRVQEEMKLAVKDEFREVEKERENIFEDERVQKAVEIANAGVELFQTFQDRKLASLDKQEAQELANAGDNEALKLDIEKKFANERYKIVKKQFIVNKAMQIANAGIDIASAVIANLKNPIMAALVGILGAVQLASIIATPPPPAPTFERGGAMITGDSGATHSNGKDVGIYGDNGQYFGRALPDEGLYIMNRSSQSALAMSDLNQKHGGRSFFSESRMTNADGGSLAPQSQQQDLGVVVDAISNMNIFVKVADISEAQGTEARVVDNASF